MTSQTHFTGFRATHVFTYHESSNGALDRRVAAAGELGWCQLHALEDVPGTAYADWRDPDTGELVPIVVCDEHNRRPYVVKE